MSQRVPFWVYIIGNDPTEFPGMHEFKDDQCSTTCSRWSAGSHQVPITKEPDKVLKDLAGFNLKAQTCTGTRAGMSVVPSEEAECRRHKMTQSFLMPCRGH